MTDFGQARLHGATVIVSSEPDFNVGESCGTLLGQQLDPTTGLDTNQPQKVPCAGRSARYVTIEKGNFGSDGSVINLCEVEVAASTAIGETARQPTS